MPPRCRPTGWPPCVALAEQLRCAVLLKGSGSLFATPSGPTLLNPTGNGLLAGGGTGDVLAGWAGGFWAQLAAEHGDAAGAALALPAAAWLHGHAADVVLARAPGSLALRAGELSEHMRAVAAAYRR